MPHIGKTGDADKCLRPLSLSKKSSFKWAFSQRSGIIEAVIKMLEEKRTGNHRNNGEIVSLEELVPKFHLLRKIDRAIEWRKIYPIVENKYSKIGRPSIDPVVLVKMVMLQHIYGIRSLRQTVAEIEVNVAYRWFIGYGITERIPHFSTISYNMEVQGREFLFVFSCFIVFYP